MAEATTSKRLRSNRNKSARHATQTRPVDQPTPPRAQTNERPTLRLVANPERVHEGARQILESSVESVTESFVESASFEDLTTWDAILTFWNDDPEGGLMGAISKVIYAPTTGTSRARKGGA